MVIGAVGSGLGGAAYVVFGNASGLSDMTLDALDGADGFRIYGITSGDGTGFAVSTAGDFNGDGFAHIIVGSESATSGGLSGRGEAHIVFGKSSGFASSIDLGNLGDADDIDITGILAADNFGASVGGGGDINGDGFDDVIIGAPGHNDGLTLNVGEAECWGGECWGGLCHLRL